MIFAEFSSASRPPGKAAPWAEHLATWTERSAALLEAGSNVAGAFGAARRGEYSRMTFLRLGAPELLLRRGYAYSINLDPDVMCVGAWDLRVLQAAVVAPHSHGEHQ